METKNNKALAQSPELPMPWAVIGGAMLLSLGAALSLGITRFAYALLLPPMRDDLGWSYTLAGGMNTANALGYLIGALCTPWLLCQMGATRVLWMGALLATVCMAWTGFVIDSGWLLAQRFSAGGFSALVFVAGGWLAARLGAQYPRHMGLLLGVYYGGTGWGIMLSAWLVPWALQQAPQPHAWTWAWWALAVACAVMTAALLWVARWIVCYMQIQNSQTNAASQSVATTSSAIPWMRFWPALLGYTLFGVGYIGYMTFVVALLREQGSSQAAITGFYALLGLSVVASSRVWAGLLDRSKGGGALALLSALLGVATILPVLTSIWWAVLVSGILFGGVFLSLVASTTALVRHNLPPVAWAAGISGFTIVFAAGQIIGPTVVGTIADGPGGLARGLVFSAFALWVGGLVALRQKPLVLSR